MPSLALGLGLSKNKTAVYSGLKLDAQAVAHYDRVIADGGIMPAGLLGCNAWFVAVKAVYAVTDITTAISAGYDPHYLGAKIGAGSGTTLGQAATKLYSCSGASGDLVQATAASMPLLLVKNSTDANYWFGSGVSGNYCSTPNAAANQITGDIEFIVYVKDYKNNGGSLYALVSKDSGTRAYTFYINSNNRLNLAINGNDLDSTVGIGATYTGWVRGNFISSNGVIKFYTSSDSETTNPLSVSWTQLGTNIAGSAGAINNISATLNIGGYNTTGLYTMHGKIVRATISNTIGGAPVVDFNPASYNAANSQTSWVSATSEVWTINTGTATTGYKGVLVDRTILQGDGVDDKMTSGTLASRQYFTSYSASKLFPTTGDRPVYSGDSASHVLYCGLGPITAYNGANLNSAVSSSLLNMPTIDFYGGLSKIRINAGSDVSGNTGILTSTTINLFSYLGSYYGNTQLNTLIQSKAVDTSTQKTAMYNAIKSFNNNAF